MYIVRRIRGIGLERLVREQEMFYQREWSIEKIHSWQLERFNTLWRKIIENVPYYNSLFQKRLLPREFRSWEEFQERIPVMSRKLVQENREELVDRSRPVEFWRITGGSTAEPVQLPAWYLELKYANRDIWYARSWFGIRPWDRLFLIWGHRHILGRGIRGMLNRTRRNCKDWLLGYFRFSAYDISKVQLQKAGEFLLKFKPDYVLGYAGALYRLACVNQKRREEFRSLRLKAIIATTESFPKNGCAEFISEIFGSPVVMEYGAIETGPIAHQTPQGYFNVFWRHYFIEVRESPHINGAYEILLTSLYPRCFPLLRYEIGDLVEARMKDEVSVRFEKVIGRCNDLILLSKGSAVHPQAFRDAISWCSSITDFQILQLSEDKIQLHYVSSQPVSSKDIEEIRRRLACINPLLGSIQIQKVNLLEQTIAGKTKRIVRITE